MSSPERPLVTFAVFAYNQEAYVRQAVEAALAQTYSPLEIILSDDASSDATAAIIREIAGAYRGPHSIVVNLNTGNLGIGEHVNKIFRMAHGELVILAAGDDVSTVERTEKLVSAWRAGSPRPLAVHSAATVTDPRGGGIGKYTSRFGQNDDGARTLISHYRGAMLLGATMAFDAALFKTFGPLRRKLPVEDIPLAVRAAMLGRVAYLDEELVRYRIGIHGWQPNGGIVDSYADYIRIRRFKAQVDYLVAKQIMVDARKLDDRRFIAMARARLAESKYVSYIARTGNFKPRRLLGTIIAAKRAWPCLAWTALLCTKLAGRLYFSFSRRFQPRLDARAFQFGD